MTKAHFIMYVADQHASTRFYSCVLGLEPALEVPGMTEFQLGADAVLGLMPERSAASLLDLSPERLASHNSVPRNELYLMVDDPAAYHLRSLTAGGREISGLSPRDWGHEAAYSCDPDGHVLAFARNLN